MTRRRETGPAKDLVNIEALLPWWAGVVVAVLTYALLHGIATQPIVATGQPGPMTWRAAAHKPQDRTAVRDTGQA